MGLVWNVLPTWFGKKLSHIYLLKLSPCMWEFLVDLLVCIVVWRWLPYMIWHQLVNIRMNSDIFPYWSCLYTCLSFGWAWWGKYSPTWYGPSSSISPWKVKYVLIGPVTIYVWVLGGVGVESIPVHDMASTCQCHNEKIQPISPNSLGDWASRALLSFARETQ